MYMKVLQLNWPLCKDYFAVITRKNMSTQFDTFFHQGLQLIFKIVEMDFMQSKLTFHHCTTFSMQNNNQNSLPTFE